MSDDGIDFQPDNQAADGIDFQPMQEGKSLAGFGHNLVQDAKDIPTGLYQAGKSILTGTPEEANKKVENMIMGIPKEIERVGGGFVSKEAPYIHPIEGIKQAAGAFYDKPISTALDVSAVKGLLPGSVGEAGAVGEAGEAAGMARQAGEMKPPVEAAPEIPLPKMKTTPQPPVKPPVETGSAPLSPFASEAKQALDKAGEVKNYISRGYEGFSKKPGMTANIADYVQSKSQMMSLQQMGFTPGQVRNLGSTPAEVHAAERSIGQYGLDSGIVSPTKGLDGMVERNHQLLNETGKQIGDLRKAADTATGGYKPGELLQAVKAKLDPIYMRGVTEENPAGRGLRSTDASSYRRALQEIEDAHPSHHEAAEVATRLNKEATQATKMSQNPGPYSDVANAISEINNERVKSIVGPENAAKYEQALREFGVNKKISNALKYKSSGEVKRIGPGSLTREMGQKFLDEVGYKVGAKAANKVSTSILKNPSIARSLPSLFKEFINQVEDVGHEITGMAYGGIAPEVSEFMRNK